MKRTLLFYLLALFTLVFPSCTEDNTYAYLGSTYEFKRDFSWDDYIGYNAYYIFPRPLADTDGIMVYILWEQADGLDVWRPLPQTTYTVNGALMYSYDYTLAHITIYLTTDYDPSYLQDGDLYDQIFRVVTLPSDWISTRKTADYDTLMRELQDSGCSYEVFDMKNEK
ncbi:MAG: hypothetical protein ACK5MI_03710 [Mangrovibacterium sp.]